MSVVISYPEMPRRMRRHFECLKATEQLEIALFGEVLSPSIVPVLERYRWWPLDGEPRWSSSPPPTIAEIHAGSL